MPKQRNLSVIFNFLPPFMIKAVKKSLFGFRGNYSSWKEAKAHSKGYDKEEIFKKVSESSIKVKTGLAAYERDGTVFDKIQYDWHWELIACLEKTSLCEKGVLSVLDFGGSLGSTYFALRGFLSDIQNLNWNVVEQKHFTDFGKEKIAEDNLKFYENIESCFQSEIINCTLFSSVLQYLEDPISVIKSIFAAGIRHIVIDRTPFTNGMGRISIQKVPFWIYKASYPARIFNLENFKMLFKDNGYELQAEFNCKDDIPGAFYKGFYFRMK